MGNINELEEMRRQLSVLNRKIESERIISDRLVRRSMRSGMSFLRRKHLFITILCVVLTPCYLVSFYQLGLSTALSIATVVFFLVIASYTLYVNNYLCGHDMMNDNLVSVRCKVAKAMKLEHDWIWIGMPMALAWVAWYGYEFMLIMKGDSMFFLLGICLGLIIGLCLGFRMRHKIMSTYSDIIAQIDDINSSDCLK